MKWYDRSDMPFRLFRIVVEFPALDRLLDYLKAHDQAELDAATEQIVKLTERLKQSGAKLAASQEK